YADFRPDNSLSRYLAPQQSAYRLAHTKPDAAVELAREITDPSTRAVTLAGVAVRLKDRARGLALIDEAMDRIVADASAPTRPLYYGGRGPAAAVVLFRAKPLGHPALAGLRAQVRAPPDGPPEGPVPG